MLLYIMILWTIKWNNNYCGAIYIFKRDEFMSNDGFPSNGSVPYVMSEIDSLDIDTVDDLKLLSKYLKEIWKGYKKNNV